MLTAGPCLPTSDLCRVIALSVRFVGLIHVHTHASPIEVLSALADAQTEAVQTRSDVQALAGKGAAAAQAALDAGKLTKAEASEVSDAVRLVSKIT